MPPNDNVRNLWTKNLGKSTNVLFKPWLLLTTALCMTTAYGHINRHIYMYISQKKDISKTDILIKDTLQITYLWDAITYSHECISSM